MLGPSFGKGPMFFAHFSHSILAWVARVKMSGSRRTVHVSSRIRNGPLGRMLQGVEDGEKRRLRAKLRIKE
jgi:hypothetical protein